MNLSKRLRLLREVAKIIQDESFTYDRQAHGADRDAALTCMDLAVEALCKKHACGLKSHNYWKSIMVSKAAEIMADKRDADLREKEERLRKLDSGFHRNDGMEAVPAPLKAAIAGIFKPIDAPPEEMDRIRAAAREIVGMIRTGERRPEMTARVCLKHNVDPYKVHQLVEQTGGEDDGD